MPGRSNAIISQITDADGDVITLSRSLEYYEEYQFFNNYSGQNESATHNIERLDLNNSSSTETVESYGGTIPPNHSAERTYTVEGTLSRAAANSMFGSFGSDVIIARTSNYEKNYSGHPDYYEETTTSTYIVNIDGVDFPAPGKSADWQPVLTTSSGESETETLNVVRTIDNKVQTVSLLGGESQTQSFYYVVVDMAPLSNGGFFAAGATDASKTDLFITSVDSTGALKKTSIALDPDLQDPSRPTIYIEAEIFEDAKGNSFYIAEYDPVTAVNTGSDELQTSVWFLSSDQVTTPLTIVGMDLDPRNVKSIAAGDTENTLLIETQQGVISFSIDRNAGTLTPILEEQRIKGTAGDDVLSGGPVNDKLWGAEGNDRLDAGAGSDTIFGGSGADTFVLDGTGSVDKFQDFSLAENDLIDVSAVAENGTRALILSELLGGKGAQKGLSITDAIDGHSYADIRGSNIAETDATDFAAADVFSGHLDDTDRRIVWIGEKIIAPNGAGAALGTANADIIIGNATTSNISGGGGDDAIFVSNSNVVSGGSGQDLFIFSSSGRIGDFAANQDRLDVTAWGADSFDDLVLAERLTGKGAGTGDLLISYNSGNEQFSLRLDGAWNTGVDADDFLFA